MEARPEVSVSKGPARRSAERGAISSRSEGDSAPRASGASRAATTAAPTTCTLSILLSSSSPPPYLRPSALAGLTMGSSGSTCVVPRWIYEAGMASGTHGTAAAIYGVPCQYRDSTSSPPTG
eukprot:scaffold82588_cov63-Phaeocystis_antarctica.AAC.2